MQDTPTAETVSLIFPILDYKMINIIKDTQIY